MKQRIDHTDKYLSDSQQIVDNLVVVKITLHGKLSLLFKLKCLSQPEQNRQGDRKEGDCVRMGDHLRKASHTNFIFLVIDELLTDQAEEMKGFRGEPVTGKSWAGQALLSSSFVNKGEVKKIKLTKSQRPFLSSFGSVEESRGTEPSFSKERSKVAASKHLGRSVC